MLLPTFFQEVFHEGFAEHIEHDGAEESGEELNETDKEKSSEEEDDGEQEIFINLMF